jgi:hypothetical protein
MAIAVESSKKIRERDFLERARRATSIFPSGNLDAHEEPDFLLLADLGTVGIEVTELCPEELRAEDARLSRVSEDARARYNQLANAGPLDVIACFAPVTENIALRQLTKGLADFVYANRHNKEAFDWHEHDLPEGYSCIAIHSTREPNWQCLTCNNTALATKQLIDSCIEKKSRRLPDYRAAASEIWLLIVIDEFLRCGGVHADADYLEKWHFTFDFEKVIVFSRAPGHHDEVIELQSVNA